MKIFFISALLISLSVSAFTQDTICVNQVISHQIESEHLSETRDYWVSLPLNYSDSISYPVIYVLDAEWRFDLARNIAFDLGGNNIIQKSIVVGIPHIDWEFKRGIDLTFSQSRIEYDGEIVDSTWYNSSNSGGAMKFYNYFMNELIPDVNNNYSTTDHETLIGHSYGGYFGGYLLSMTHPFEVIHMYDPAIWYSNGEVIERIKNNQIEKDIKVVISYQPKPDFHKSKIEELIELLNNDHKIDLTTFFYEHKTHNSLYLDSFYKGIQVTNETINPPIN
ncbi:alpha/beta hydrolase-fold protein [Mangrovivirga sp. M17]|uniref:Alpha/beta hydrolase-fold protein n=1 Tax=Mangrovivirga halotolerans TaxID=2993936 RepID=A0ABT3RR29_9BACT|nr:alpha/beta hydrolase-fold protein [Mangrovivirga halotolerans]MCX2743722.1 alpha/beta hydrolase-fold protein [Mangrovivirga halotolerans]